VVSSPLASAPILAVVTLAPRVAGLYAADVRLVGRLFQPR